MILSNFEANQQINRSSLNDERQSLIFGSQLLSNAKGQIKRLSIDQSLLKPEEKEILEDLVVAAINDSKQKGEAAAQEEMKSLTGGLPLPPGMKLPF